MHAIANTMLSNSEKLEDTDMKNINEKYYYVEDSDDEEYHAPKISNKLFIICLRLKKCIRKYFVGDADTYTSKLKILIWPHYQLFVVIDKKNLILIPIDIQYPIVSKYLIEYKSDRYIYDYCVLEDRLYICTNSYSNPIEKVYVLV